MKERGILMTPENIQATIEGRKSMTRRVIKPQPTEWEDGGLSWKTEGSINRARFISRMISKCPYGQVGGFLYLKEAHYRFGQWYMNGFSKTGRQKWRFASPDNMPFRYIDNPPDIVRPNSYRSLGWYKRSPLFMPKKYARYWYEITGIRAERVQDISEEDAMAEGVNGGCLDCGYPQPCKCIIPNPSYTDSFIYLWDSINAKRGHPWSLNEWVWVIESKVVE